MRVTRELAIKILKYLDQHKDFYFPFLLVNKEYAEDDGDFIEVEPGKWKDIEMNELYQTFELWENLQNLDEKTTQLMARGFIEEIIEHSLEAHIAILAKNYRSEWKEELSENKNIEEYGLNEFICGKAEAYEDCLDLIRNYHQLWI